MTKEEFEHELIGYGELSSKLEKAISKSIEGSLKIRSKQSCFWYYIKTKDGERYLSKKDPKSVQTIKMLAQKGYYEKVLRVTEKLKKQLEKLKKLGFPNAVSDVYRNLSIARKRFVKPIASTDDDYAEEWLERRGKLAGNDHFQDFLKFETDNGTVVRSKSEALIANKLISRRVPFVYEARISLNEGASVIHPDFLVLNKRTRKELCWEHFGKMDDPSYMKDALFKINSYIRAGYVLGKDFLITLESDEMPLDLNALNRIIDGLLI